MRRARGFTLLELMIVVVIIAILAALAMSGYSSQIRKSRRAEAKQTISEVALRQEKWRSNRPLYIGTDSSTADKELFGTIHPGEFYNVAITSVASGTAFTITGTPKGDQTQDKCGTLSYGVSGATVTKGPAGCW